MKKNLIFFICSFSFWFLISDLCLAAPAGNPAGPALLEGHFPTKFSMQAEAVFKRDLKTEEHGTPRFSGLFYTGKISVYTNKKLDVYGIIGTYNGKVKNFIDSQYIIETKMCGAWGLGVSYVLREWVLENGILRVGADAKYRQFKPDVSDIMWYRSDIAATNEGLTFNEWQGSLGLSYQYKKVIPYMGLKYSDMRAHIKFIKDGTTQYDAKATAKNKLGFFYGTDILVADNVSFNIEGRMVDEQAVNVELSARF